MIITFLGNSFYNQKISKANQIIFHIVKQELKFRKDIKLFEKCCNKIKLIQSVFKKKKYLQTLRIQIIHNIWSSFMNEKISQTIKN